MKELRLKPNLSMLCALSQKYQHKSGITILVGQTVL